ncbi:MAG: hypothetical protein V1739_09270 [Candidatus Omnitrophota bacterium]
MDRQTIDIIGNIFLVILGFGAAIFHKYIAKITVEQHYKLLHIRFSEKGYEITFLLAGIMFITIGVLSIFGIIKF